MTSNDLDSRLDELYGGAPEDFVANRKRIADELKQAGEKEEAARVRKLKRPTRAASITNRLSLAHRSETRALLAAGAVLRDLQARLGGGNLGAELREAAATEREAIERLTDLARDELGASGAVLDRVAETLQATGSDEQVAKAVESARLEREQRAAGLGGGSLLLAADGAADEDGRGEEDAGSEQDESERAARLQREREQAKARKEIRRRLRALERSIETAAAKEKRQRDRREQAERKRDETVGAHEAARSELAALREQAAEASAELERLPG